jgi:hypothetical protein
MSTRRKIQVFTAGTHTASNGTQITFSAEQVRAMAEGYDAVNHPCPVVVGHPDDTAPAYAWAANFSVDDTKAVKPVLSSEIHQIAPSFAAAVQEGRYKRVSLALFGPDHPSNPKPGQYYPRHIGFLGGAAPAIPGLQPVTFAGTHDKVVTLEFEAPKLDDADPASFMQALVTYVRQAMDLPAPAFKAPTTIGKTEDTTMADKTAQQQLEEAQTQIVALKQQHAAAAKAQATAAATAFCAKFVAAKKLKPADVPAFTAVVALLAAAPEIEFAAADGTSVKQAPLGVLERILNDSAAVVNTTEKSAPGAGGGDLPATVTRTSTFSAPSGFAVDATQLKIRDAANKLVVASGGKLDFAAAVDQVIAGTAEAA